ncbi:thiamine phosphate synthase [bacterium D16-51]|nr:thiamine phosphate synthase [bacterium D16-59]RKI56137.1 thiamine phosphate synthase [bacterium D16-51]
MCKLIAVTNRKLCRGDFLGQIEILAEAGVDSIVLREKDLGEEEYEPLAIQVLDICREYRTECILHQNIGIAGILGQKKIHLSLPAAQKNKEALKGFQVVGVSTHSLEQVQEAEKCNASYVFFGHVFPTDCKKGVPPRGLHFLQEICHNASVPVYAIGGITPQNAAQAVKAGAAGVCVMSWGMQEEKSQIQSFVAACHRM